MTNCILCQRPLAETTGSFFLHEVVEDCLVRVTDSYGVSLDDDYEVVGDDIWSRTDLEEQRDIIVLPTFKPMEDALIEIFRDAGLERLGGRSSGSGWSSVSTFQKCRYLWKMTYLNRRRDQSDAEIIGEIVPLAIGILVHTYLALHYQRMLVAGYPLTPDDINQRVRELGCNPEVFLEAWRLYTGYRLFYKHESIVPLAVEANFMDPRTRDSCRYDMIAFFPDEAPGRLPGTYIVEHKTSGRFDQATLEGWVGDGEILGQVSAWDRLHLDRRFGPLRGVLVNLLGKQQKAQFHRTLAAPTAFAIEQHRYDLKQTNAEIKMAIAADHFPRSRASCIHRYGMCALWRKCNFGED